MLSSILVVYLLAAIYWMVALPWETIGRADAAFPSSSGLEISGITGEHLQLPLSLTTGLSSVLTSRFLINIRRTNKNSEFVSTLDSTAGRDRSKFGPFIVGESRYVRVHA